MRIQEEKISRLLFYERHRLPAILYTRSEDRDVNRETDLTMPSSFDWDHCRFMQGRC